jgi:hypothetical protein
MNIFKALFGAKKEETLESPNSQTPSVHWHLAGVIQVINRSESVEELNRYSRDYSGYAREAVLKRCVELGQPELLPIVVERLNDWVPQVRDMARRALMTLLPFAPVRQLLEALPGILRLHGGGRGDHADWLKGFEFNLIQTIAVNEIIAAAQTAEVKVARACVHLLKKHRLIEPAALIDLVLGRSDDIVLTNEAIQLCTQLPAGQQGAQYRAAARSHFGSVRTVAVRALLERESEPRMTIAVAALMDVQSSVRYAAMAYLKTSDFDVQAYYRNMLQEQRDVTKHVRVCLTALATLNDIGDLELIKSFLSDERISIRLVAFAGWFRLAEQDKDAIALTALSDTQAGVRKFALRMVRKYRAYIPFADIQRILGDKGDVGLLLLFAESQKWNWLECIARLGLQRGAEELAGLGVIESLRVWLAASDRWNQRPSKEQLDFLTSEPVKSALRNLAKMQPNQMLHLEQELARERASFS